jgi:hypothetical protein
MNCTRQAPPVSSSEGFRVTQSCSYRGLRRLPGVEPRRECFSLYGEIRDELLSAEGVVAEQAVVILRRVRDLFEQLLAPAKRAPPALGAFCSEVYIDRHNAKNPCTRFPS